MEEKNMGCCEDCDCSKQKCCESTKEEEVVKSRSCCEGCCEGCC